MLDSPANGLRILICGMAIVTALYCKSINQSSIIEQYQSMSCQVPVNWLGDCV